MTSRVKVYDKTGKQLAELDTNVKRTWKMNVYSTAEFALSLFDTKATLENLEYGNYLIVTHETLPIWGGMIDLPRDWGDKTVAVTANSGEFILTTRRMPSVKVEGYGGLALKQIIDIANNQGATLLQIGDYAQNNCWMAKNLDVPDCYEAVQEFVKTSGQEWCVTPEFDVYDNLYFKVNWYVKSGMECFEKLLESKNFGLNTKPLSEQGKIINDLMGFGSGATWDSKGSVQKTDQTSIDRYGLRQGSIGFGDDMTGTLEASTDAELQKSKDPHLVFDLKALDVGHLFENLRLGNTLPIKMHSAGFAVGGNIGLETRVRILGMTYDDLSNTVDLIAEEVNP